MPDLPTTFPERVGRYDLLLPIAAGGMATVYLARSEGIGGFAREVALKLTHAHLRSDPRFAADLIEEAKLAARIRHPNVVPVLDVGDDAAGIYLVMEYVEGEALGALARAASRRGERVPLAIGLRILVDALAGLHAAHELKDGAGRSIGLVHRDFSPQNLLVDVAGRGLLADFGVAKAATRPGHTMAGFVKGKVAYMSPEQARGLALDRTCDVWAAGVVAWELATGKRLYPPGDEVNRLLKIVTEQPPRARAIADDVPAALDEAIARALAMDARRRTPTAAALAKDLTRSAAEIGGLAELDDVAAYVEEMAGEALVARRARVEAVLLRRASFAAATELAPARALDDMPTSDERPRGELRDPSSES
ncbi:MAG TPA: serine/threonine-protein kinase, partial [Minicystis sp.]|nr:serine/threonine-protein kinase [Minicystis sp.]